MNKRIALLAIPAVVAGALAFAAAPAHADPAGVPVVQNAAGEAGYFANDNGQTRFRDVRAQVDVTNQIKNLNGAVNNLGGVGVELCDPNTGYAAQLGVQWNGTAFVVQYGHGNLGNMSDPCIQSGLVSNPTPLSPLAIHPATGDHLQFEIFYQPVGHHHFIIFNVCDTTQDVCRQAQIHVQAQNFYEAGVGVVSNSGVVLTAPALNQLVSFSNCAFNYYSSTHNFNSIFVPAHWKLDRSDWDNSSSQVIMSSNGSLDAGGHGFTMFNGSTSI
jgi:hypothetical protein